MGKKKKKGKEIKYNESPVSHYQRGKIKHQKKTERKKKNNKCKDVEKLQLVY